MPNKQYIKGRRKEYKVMEQARRRGCSYVLRSAGSHSPIDIVAIDVLNNRIEFIQCKPDTMSDNKKEELEHNNRMLNGVFKCSFYVE